MRAHKSVLIPYRARVPYRAHVRLSDLASVVESVVKKQPSEFLTRRAVGKLIHQCPELSRISNGVKISVSSCLFDILG
jgi:hypothetical protein